MWNRKRKVYKYYISKMVWVGREKNLDFRAGPDMLDIYERRDSECTKEVYDCYPHEKVNNTSACYFRKEDTYTYCKYVGDEIVSPQESYDMVKKLLSIPIEKIKTSSKSNVKWAIQAIDILIHDKKCDIVNIEMQFEKYTENYIKTRVTTLNEDIYTLRLDKKRLENIYDALSNRKNERLEKKKQEEEFTKNLLREVEMNCTCGFAICYTYNKCYCGNCGQNVENLWKKMVKKLVKEQDKQVV